VVQRDASFARNLLALRCSSVFHLVYTFSPYVLLLRGSLRQRIECCITTGPGNGPKNGCKACGRKTVKRHEALRRPRG